MSAQRKNELDADSVLGLSSGEAAAGIVAGAFGSHGLQKRGGITPEKLHAWQTASSYAVSLVVDARPHAAEECSG